MKQKQLNKPPPKIKSLMIMLIHQSQIVLKYVLLCFSRLFKMNKERCRKYKVQDDYKEVSTKKSYLAREIYSFKKHSCYDSF